jgi:hypothetical protein
MLVYSQLLKASALILDPDLRTSCLLSDSDVSDLVFLVDENQ